MLPYLFLFQGDIPTASSSTTLSLTIEHSIPELDEERPVTVTFRLKAATQRPTVL
jgi:hypothetical protein